MSEVAAAHPDLVELQKKLQVIYDSIDEFRPPAKRLPILDSSLELSGDGPSDEQWIQQDHISGLKKLKDTIGIDLGVLDKFLSDPKSSTMPALSTNAPYLIAVWNELVCAPGRVVAVFKSFDAHPRSTRMTKEERKTAKMSNKGKENRTKVDIVAERGLRWIRVNTIKNNRILAEFREIDSYLTDESDDDDEYGPTLAQTEFDNSILRMGRTLLQAAQANPIFDGLIPKITLRLTRLDPNEPGVDPRVAKTIHLLQDMGVDVELGEQDSAHASRSSSAAATPSTSVPTRPTHKVNIDLSVFLALVSDLTHAALPTTVEEANARYIPSPTRTKEWKSAKRAAERKKMAALAQTDAKLAEELDKSLSLVDDDEEMQVSRQLTNQVKQEAVRGMLQEIREQLLATTGGSLDNVEFYTTDEARKRCLKIVEKIGGPNERRRAEALMSGDIDAYWAGSRYEKGYVPLMPLHFMPDPIEPVAGIEKSAFFDVLEKTCEDLLAPGPDETLRAKRITLHTVRTLLWGARMGWTTLTANRTSVRAILGEMKARRISDVEGGYEFGEQDGGSAAIWIVDPRSLAEYMRNDFEEPIANAA
ncbi:hypothetical protein CYLTODRAFT_456631 [Cylindrobasidium torrendii FP15055 ss-10]|uniref:DUF1308 domain-containing protein n=1 Tax=Cylindrobasidium torrendii FP15055 ss-10 TaxID=1314674 RepID=A0A0D7B3B5_9AGAR|nr:hypothetical protein CYLTODRAFT_456631 [Cylindrobasidium torrendii FP15055 ss-10]